MEKKKNIECLCSEVKKHEHDFKEIMDEIKPYVKKSEFIFDAAHEKWDVSTQLNIQTNSNVCVL